MAISSLIFGILGPLVLYFVWGKENPIVAKIGKKLINTQITFIVAVIALVIINIILAFIPIIGPILALVLFLGFMVLVLYVVIKQIIQVYHKQYDELIGVPFFMLNLMK